MTPDPQENLHPTPSEHVSTAFELETKGHVTGVRLFCQCLILAKAFESLFLWWSWHQLRQTETISQHPSHWVQWAELIPWGSLTALFGAFCLLVYLSKTQSITLMLKNTGISFLLFTLFLEWCEYPLKFLQ